MCAVMDASMTLLFEPIERMAPIEGHHNLPISVHEARQCWSTRGRWRCTKRKTGRASSPSCSTRNPSVKRLRNTSTQTRHDNSSQRVDDDVPEGKRSGHHSRHALHTTPNSNRLGGIVVRVRHKFVKYLGMNDKYM